MSTEPLNPRGAIVDLNVTGLNEYQERTRETAIYPGAGKGSRTAIIYCALGLGEAGEVQGKVKKVIRDSGGQMSDEVRSQILAELGDLFWYVTRMADEMGFSLQDLARQNLIKLFSRKARGVIGGSGDTR